MNEHVCVGLVQHACTEDREHNLASVAAGVGEAAARGANLVVLQELHNSLYFCQDIATHYFDLAEPIPGPSTHVLAELARNFGVVIVGSVFERRAAGVYHNTAVVLERDGEIAGIYRKMHIPDDPGYYEKFYFTPGDLGFEPIDTSVGRLGVMVCWDQWYPEAARLMALAGAQILIYPTAIGWTPTDPPEEQTRQRDAWITIQRSHAIANGTPVVATNRTGFERDPAEHLAGTHFWGSSFVAGPQGEVIAQAPVDEATVMVVDVDLKRGESVRRWWPFLRDRRIDAYGDLVLRFRPEKR
jgi:N-carbamoylputrescine amidase